MRTAFEVRGKIWLSVGLLCAGMTLTVRSGAEGRKEEKQGAHEQRVRALKVQEGVLTMDGLTVKTHVNFHTTGLRYLYLSLPGTGIVQIAEQPFAGAEEEKGAFHGNVLTVFAGGRRLELTSSTRLRKTRSAYVRFEPGAGAGGMVPAIGYGNAALNSVVWASDEELPARGAKRLNARGRRALRTARLCQPTKDGRERCAIVREVVYRP